VSTAKLDKIQIRRTKMDAYADRITHLESVVFQGVPAITPRQVISQAGEADVVVQGGLVLIVAPGSVELNLPLPSIAQNGLTITFLSANCAAPWVNLINTSAGGIILPGIPSQTASQMSDSGSPGSLCVLTAQNGVWAFLRGWGWSAVL
jgi:hypothetical protein